MTKKSRLQKLKTKIRKESQKSLRTQKEKQLNKIASNYDGVIVEENKLESTAPIKGIITFRREDVLVGRSIYNIMEDTDAD